MAALSPVPVYVRAHNLLTTGDGTPALKWGSTNAYTEDADRQAGLRLDDRRSHLRHLHGAEDEAAGRDRLHARGAVDATPSLPAPLDARPRLVHRHLHRLELSAEGLRQVARADHQWVDALRGEVRQAEVESWFWEVWNEPNIGYWQGTPEEYHKLYDYAADGRQARAARRRASADPTSPARTARARSDSCATSWSTACAARTTRPGRPASPLDFISFHAKGAPRFVDGNVAHGHQQPVARHRQRLRDRRVASRAAATSRSSSANPTPKAAPRARRASIRRTPTATARCIRATPPSSWRAPTTWPTQLQGEPAAARSRGRSSSRTSRGSTASAIWPPTASTSRC